MMTAYLQKPLGRPLYLFVLIMVSMLACSDDDDVIGPDGEVLVNVFGTVVNIDTGASAPGVVVSVLDAEDQYHSDLTGTDGRFSLDVPEGAAFSLVTNDYAGLDADTAGLGLGVANDWITLINVEPMIPSIDSELETVVHACPTPESPHTWLGGTANLGSVAIWRNFLQNSTMAAEFTNAPNVWGRNFAFLHAGTPPNEDLGFPVSQITGIRLELDENRFGKVGYWAIFQCFNLEYPGLEGQGVQDSGVGPDIFVPDATANGPAVSLTTAFANSEYTEDTVSVTLIDTDDGRAIDFSEINPVILPLRDGATTVLMLGSVDNQIASLTEGLCAAGATQVGCR